MTMRSRTISLHVYFQNLTPLAEALKKLKQQRLPHNKTHWINTAIGDRIKREAARPMEEGARPAAAPPALHLMLTLPWDCLQLLDAAARTAGMSRNKWAVTAILSSLGVAPRIPPPVENVGGLAKIQLEVYPQHAEPLERCVDASGCTRTRWINDAIRERLERDGLLPVAQAPMVEAAAPAVPAGAGFWE